jgi:hypothetical protein
VFEAEAEARPVEQVVLLQQEAGEQGLALGTSTVAHQPFVLELLALQTTNYSFFEIKS